MAAEPTFPKEFLGDWHVLLGVPATNLGIQDEDTGLIGGKVKFEADRLTLDLPGEQPETVLTADCKLLTEQRVDEKNRPVPGKEAEAKLAGKVTGDRRLLWATSDAGHLHVKILTSDPPKTKGFRGFYLSNQFGGDPEALYLVLRRQAVPARSKHDKAADAKRILGEWTAVAHYDDAFLKNPGLTGKRTFSITAERINELDAKGQFVRPPVGFWGAYQIAEPVGALGAIDLQLESWAGGGAGLMGRTPSLLAFYGDDLLYIAYNETDKRPEDKRTRCERLRSDGNHNLFILERITNPSPTPAEPVKK
ncbi:hypothetical protein [Anatilimnocola aggregata]|uniref:hypothetical protein n=1 Tax=Anatilimnocola aggregata TaxID=2528021 RepID=UPI0011A24D3C|nr:hypothetical protein [Anatilimnocola aggregata]